MTTTIKLISTHRYEIGLYEIEGQYIVAYSSSENAVVGEPIADFNIASYLFEMKRKELEGT